MLIFRRQQQNERQQCRPICFWDHRTDKGDHLPEQGHPGVQVQREGGEGHPLGSQAPR